MFWWTEDYDVNGFMKLNPGFLPKVISPIVNKIDLPAFNDNEPAECSLLCLPLVVSSSEITSHIMYVPMLLWPPDNHPVTLQSVLVWLYSCTRWCFFTCPLEMHFDETFPIFFLVTIQIILRCTVILFFFKLNDILSIWILSICLLVFWLREHCVCGPGHYTAK